MEIELWWLWFVAGILLMVGEMFTTSFYLLWLGIAAMVASALAFFFPEAYWLPPIGASITGILLIVFTKPLTARFAQAKGYADPNHSLANRTGEIIEPVTPTRLGIVKVGTEIWSASAQEELYPGQRVLVVGQSSTILQVKPVLENVGEISGPGAASL